MGRHSNVGGLVVAILAITIMTFGTGLGFIYILNSSGSGGGSTSTVTTCTTTQTSYTTTTTTATTTTTKYITVFQAGPTITTTYGTTCQSLSTITSTKTSTTTTTSTTSTTTGPQNLGPLYPLPISVPVAKQMYVVTDQSWGYTLTALQGLIARSGPQIFFEQNPTDVIYLNLVESQGGITVTPLSASQALQKFVPSFVSQTSGKANIVVFDSNEPASDFYWETNTARTIAGVTGALPVGSSQLSTFAALFPNNYNILYDLTKSPCSGCVESLSGALAGYQWSWNTFGGQTTRNFLTMSPNGRFMGGDFEVEFRSFVFTFCNPTVVTGCTYDTNQQALANQILNAYPAGSVAMGFFGLNGEGPTISALSSRGILQDNSELATNLSVYAGLPALTATSPQQAASLTPSSITYDPSKRYVLWEYSQGDADTYEFYSIQRIYQQVDQSTHVPYRDEIPVSVQLKTMMAQTAPPVMATYYSDRNSLADFMTAPSGGAGYGHPESMPSGTATGSEYWYVQLSKSLAINSGVRTVFVIWGGGLSTNAIQTYIQDWGSPKPYALYFWQNNGQAPQMISGVPTFTTSFWVPNFGTGYNSQEVSDTAQCIEGAGVPTDPTWANDGGKGPCNAASVASGFINPLMNTQFPGYDFIQAVMTQLGPNYIAVNSQQYACLYLQSQGLSC